jgi:hypothetical protein
MTMRYVDVALTDIQREFEAARSKPRHLVPQHKLAFISQRKGVEGLLDCLVAAQHTLEILRRTLPNGPRHTSFDRFSNRLTKIMAEVRKLPSA